MDALIGRAATVSYLSLVLLLSATVTKAQQGARNGDWQAFGADLGSTKYTPLDRIDPERGRCWQQGERHLPTPLIVAEQGPPAYLM